MRDAKSPTPFYPSTGCGDFDSAYLRHHPGGKNGVSFGNERKGFCSPQSLILRHPLHVKNIESYE